MATLPLLATTDSDPSPYLPSTRLAWNDVYVDIESVPELKNDDPWAARARDLLAQPEFRDRLTRLAQASHADPAAVAAAKRPLTELLAMSLSNSSGPRRSAFKQFVEQNPRITAYARFQAAADLHGQIWQQWPSELSGGQISDQTIDPTAVHHHQYSQWLANNQIARAAETGLYMDMPVGVAPSGFDTWSESQLFAMALSVGAPPDAFFAAGQSWGCPPLHPEAIRDTQYRYVVAAFRFAMRYASLLRIDHVMSLHRLFCIPQGFDPADGAYIHYNAEELYAIVAIESTRSSTVVVGEDLGTVPDLVRREMARHGLQRSFVFQFESSTDIPLPAVPEAAVASLGTHDLAPFAAYWEGRDIDDRCRRGLLDDEEAAAQHEDRRQWAHAVSKALAPGSEFLDAKRARRGCLAHLSAGAASTVVVDVDDLWLEKEPQNRPGTGPDAGNFTRRAARPIEALADRDAVDALDVVRRGRVSDGDEE